VRCGFHI